LKEIADLGQSTCCTHQYDNNIKNRQDNISASEKQSLGYTSRVWKQVNGMIFYFTQLDPQQQN
jgi:hypothetical protein